MEEVDIINLNYFDPYGRLASAYVIRTWFSEKDFYDGLFCARNKEEAFEQMLKDYATNCPNKKIEKFELLRIDGGIKNRKNII